MKYLFPWYIRLPLIFFASAVILEYAIDTEELPAFIEKPEVLGLLAIILLVLISFEACYAAINSVLWHTLTEEEREAKLAIKESNWWSGFLKKATNATPIDEEEEIFLNHNYDGIKELDNALPPWWVWGFYATILFAVIYLARYHMFGGETQEQEFETEMAQAKIDIEEYKKTAKNLVDYKTATILTEASDIASGKEIFMQNCAVCHKPDGGGNIGPNLTDNYWILGGGINNIFKSISEGGRPGKGMEPWSKNGLKSYDIQQVASYITTLSGTNPPEAKKAEGELWKDDTVKEEVIKQEADSLVIDTLQVNK
ncbi:cbb3-type cytochrome c oxidase N-terminal domain-containing protein [Pseudofulvibacter geojedonensis]|uniref:Cbb3-type cytochrome c oxidase N-terminal domain-containing protein n=1 Tax=Pseudofulvibacter geojedonensis TaxID=1123758 RepID=A0ABW3I299_9FLAO